MEHSVILNIETSGLDPERDSIIGIYAIEIDERLLPTGHIFFTRLKEWQTFNTLICDIVGYYPEDFEKAPTFNQIKDEFFRFIENRTLIGFAMDFDLAFWAKMRGKSFENKMIDVKTLFENQFPHIPIRLDDLSVRLNIKTPKEFHADYCLTTCYQILELYKYMYFK